MSKLFLTRDELETLKQVRIIGDLLCYECAAKRANSFAGQAFTDFKCGRCRRTISYHNTGTPNYCKACAIETFKCQRCMQSLEKDLVPTPITPTEQAG